MATETFINSQGFGYKLAVIHEGKAITVPLTTSELSRLESQIREVRRGSPFSRGGREGLDSHGWHDDT